MDVALIVGIAASLAALWATLLVVFWLLRPKGVSAREIVALVPGVVRLLRDVIRDGRAHLDIRVVLVVVMVWLVSPIDLIPEFIPGVGPLDDVVVAILALRYTRRRMGVEHLRARWSGSQDGFAILLRVIGTG